MGSKKKKNYSAKPARKSKKRPVIIGSVLGVLIVAGIAVLTVFNIANGSRQKELCDYQWVASSATNASGDEVEMSEVYNTNYSSYKGSLGFREDGSFSLWLSPGEADDGTHTGKYSVRADDVIEAYFDDGTNTTFKIKRTDGKADGIEINYNDYSVLFVNE